MRAERGLPRRLVVAFTRFGLVLAVMAGALLYSPYHDSEDAVQRRYLDAQHRLFLEEHADISTSRIGAIAAVSALVAMVGAALGATVARSIVHPVVRLAERVRARGPDATDLGVNPADFPAEVRTLAQALHDEFRPSLSVNASSPPTPATSCALR